MVTPQGEESPGSTGQDTGEIPVPATERTCHRNDTAPEQFSSAGFRFTGTQAMLIRGKGEMVE